MKKLLIFLVSIIFGFILNGCTTFPFDHYCERMDSEYKAIVIPSTDWDQVAESYRDNYNAGEDALNTEQKARLLIDQLNYEHADYNTKVVEYRIKVTHIYMDGHRIWPIKGSKPKIWDKDFGAKGKKMYKSYPEAIEIQVIE